jgi:hypothetical protein
MDTIITHIVHLANPDIVFPWNENFEEIPDTEILADRIGLPGLAAWDCELEPTCRIRTFAGSPFCRSGERALTVDATQNSMSKEGKPADDLNLENYTAADDDIRMSFYYMHHEIIPDVVNTESVWIRGSDTDPLVLLTYLPNEAADRGIYKHIAGLEISTVLEQFNQDFSSSFQVMFSHDVKGTAGQTTSEDGQTIDDISFDLIQRDIKMDQFNFSTSKFMRPWCRVNGSECNEHHVQAGE